MIAIDPIEINDVKLPYHSAYVYVEEIEYTSQVKRSIKGKIPSWPSYYFIATIDVVWNFLTHQEYQNLMNLVRLPDFKMRYFDVNSGVYKVGKFYCPQKMYNDMVAKYATIEGYEGISLRFIATNNDIEEDEEETEGE